MRCGCRAFGFRRRRDRFDLLPVQARGFTPAGHRQGQLELVWRSRLGHETPDLLALSFDPLSGTVRAFGLAVPPLRFASASPPSGCTGDLHPQNCRTCSTQRPLVPAGRLGPQSGPGGSVSVSAESLTIEGGAQIASSTAGPGKGGDVRVTVASDITTAGPRTANHCAFDR
jgi:hypothetical protein